MILALPQQTFTPKPNICYHLPPGSEREFQRALGINPNYGTARMWYGQYLEAMGRLGEAIAEHRRALEDEPLSLIISTMLGQVLYIARRYDQAMEQLRKTLDLDPSFALAHFNLGLVYEQKGMFAEAIAELRQITPPAMRRFQKPTTKAMPGCSP